jgi:hypothetical protein
MQSISEKGLLVLNTHNVTLSHNDKILRRIGNIYESAFNEVSSAIKSENLLEQLRVKPLAPLFKVR